MNSRLSPGRKKPISSPVSAKTMALMTGMPPHLIRVWSPSGVEIMCQN